jgi:hypothetical protein
MSRGSEDDERNFFMKVLDCLDLTVACRPSLNHLTNDNFLREHGKFSYELHQDIRECINKVFTPRVSFVSFRRV